jgi:hypothetical protein
MLITIIHLLGNMKKILAIYITFIVLGAMLFGACSNDPMSKERLGKDDGFEVEYLFEKDGVKMYRFYDDGHAHYFTTMRETISTQDTRNGKTTNYHEENIKAY